MIFKLIALIPTTLLAIVLFRAVFVFKPLPAPKSCINSPGHERIKVDQSILDRFKGALDIPTISHQAGEYEPAQLNKMMNFIQLSFPKIHSSQFIKRETVANYTLVYMIDGIDRSLRPYMLTSHMDVVPVVRENWSSDPFKTVLKDNYIYARGAIDAKHLLMSMLEALEYMIKRGFRPKRSFYLVFGHDEEISGLEGARNVALLLSDRIKHSNWDKLEYILDEGNIISETKFPGLNSNIGLIGVSEKGYLTVKLSVTGQVGHGSMPPSQTSIAKLSSVVGRFHSHLLPSFFGQGVEKEMIDIFAAYASWPYKLLYANLWLFKPVFEYIFSSDPSTNSLIRSSTAVTLMSGGTKENVLPDSATAYINHRVHPLQSIGEILDFDRRVINDPTILVERVNNSREPSPIAPYCDDCYGFQLIKQSILQVYPGTIVVPSTFLAASDSRWYTNLTDSIYKFSAIAVHLEEMKRFHGNDERISLENYENLINFYHHLIQNSDSAKLNFKSELRSEL